MGAKKAQGGRETEPVVFVAHAHADAELARKFSKVCESVGLSREQVFMTSHFASRAPDGKRNRERLSDAIQSAAVLVALLTDNFFKSDTCKAELGILCYESSEEKVFIPFSASEDPSDSELPKQWLMSGFDELSMTDMEALEHLGGILHQRFGVKKPWNAEKKSWQSATGEFVEYVENNRPKLLPSFESVDYRSVREFLHVCERAHRTLFFNVHVSLEEWFRPEMQVHLALQDAASSFYQLSTLVNGDARIEDPVTKEPPQSHLPDYFGTPSARVLFVNEERKKLVKRIKKGDATSKRLTDLILIHLFMATPLAIVTRDQLAKMMLTVSPNPEKRDELDFMRDDYEKFLGLPEEFETNIAGDKRRAIDVLQKKLEPFLSRMQSFREGVLEASIDFALLMGNDHPDEIWKGVVEGHGEHLRYLNVENREYREGEEVIEGVFSAFTGNPYLALHAFGKIVERNVFSSPARKNSPKDQNEKENKRDKETLASFIGNDQRRARLLADCHPTYRVFHKDRDSFTLSEKFRHAIKFVRNDYCPFKLINDADDPWNVFTLVDFKGQPK